MHGDLWSPPAEARRLCQFWQANRQKNPTLSTKKKKYGGGNLKNESRGGFSGGARDSLAGAGVGAELQHFVLKWVRAFS